MGWWNNPINCSSISLVIIAPVSLFYRPPTPPPPSPPTDWLIDGGVHLTGCVWRNAQRECGWDHIRLLFNRSIIMDLRKFCTLDCLLGGQRDGLSSWKWHKYLYYSHMLARKIGRERIIMTTAASHTWTFQLIFLSLTPFVISITYYVVCSPHILGIYHSALTRVNKLQRA